MKVLLIFGTLPVYLPFQVFVIQRIISVVIMKNNSDNFHHSGKKVMRGPSPDLLKRILQMRSKWIRLHRKTKKVNALSAS